MTSSAKSDKKIERISLVFYFKRFDISNRVRPIFLNRLKLEKPHFLNLLPFLE